MNQMVQPKHALVLLLAPLVIAGCKKSAAESERPNPSPPPVGVSKTASERRITSASGDYKVIFDTEPNPIPLNEMFSMRVRVLDKTHKLILPKEITMTVDAAMPEHRHGMNTNPKVSPAEGEFKVTGMLFHMPGFWQIHFDIIRDGVTDRATYDVNLD